MSIKLISPILNKNKSLDDIKLELSSLIGNDILVLEKRTYCNDVVYVFPRRLRVLGKTNNFLVVEESNSRIKECLLFADFYTKDKIYEVVES